MSDAQTLDPDVLAAIEKAKAEQAAKAKTDDTPAPVEADKAKNNQDEEPSSTLAPATGHTFAQNQPQDNIADDRKQALAKEQALKAGKVTAQEILDHHPRLNVDNDD